MTKAADLRKKEPKELIKSVQELKKKLSDMRFSFASNRPRNVKETANLKKEIARTLTVLKEVMAKKP